MKNFSIILFASVLLFFSCKDKPKRTFNIQGHIEGFTKGTILLKKKQDSMFVAVDSFVVKNQGHFILSDNLESPEVYYLKIKEVPNDSILVFGEKTTASLHTTLDKLSLSAKIKGSKNHDLLSEYKKMIHKFNDSRLDLFKANFEAEQSGNQKALDSLDKIYKNHIKRQYLYTTNFAVNHADMAVAPYIALTQLYNAKISLLDTVNNSLTDEIKNSKYGKQLDRFITVIKKNEQIN